MSVLVFDLDGTLVSSMDDLVVSLNVVLTSAGHNAIPSKDIGHMVGMGAKVLIQRGLEYNDIVWTDELVSGLFEHFLEHYAANIAVHTKPFPGVVAALETFKENGVKLAVCTNKAERLTLPLLDALDLTRYFDAVVGGDTFPVSKPDAKPIHGAIERAGGTVSGSIMIGDSVTDINAARNAGIPVIAVDFGYTPVPVTELGPDKVISHFDELAGALDEVRCLK
ncbi:MAG: HAD-IA family hydrolase [Roseibium sp.]